MPRTNILSGLLLSMALLTSPSRGQTSPDELTDIAPPTPTMAIQSRMAALRARIHDVRDHYATREINTREHSAWEAMHIALAYGLETPVRVGGPQGERQNAVGCLCFNHSFRTGGILSLRGNSPTPVGGAGRQGHPGQLLAVLAQTRLRRDYPMWVAGREFKVEDLIEYEKRTCRTGTELTFKLIGLSHYLPSDATWTCDNGQRWSIERLLREEIRQPIQGASCGGTHRLTGLSYAVRKRVKEGKPLSGQFKRADTYLRAYHKYAFALQNDDGSFSTRWLESREARRDLARRLQTTGHILEWLAYSVDEDGLRQPEMLRAVEYLADMLSTNKERRWELGGLGHALHGLAIYDRRMFPESADPEPPAKTVPAVKKRRSQLDRVRVSPLRVTHERGPMLIPALPMRK